MYSRKSLAYALAIMLSCGVLAVHAQPGIYLPGAGAVNGGMAGVSTAKPVDALGAMFWNPAAIGRLGHNEASIGGAFIYPDITLSSSLPQIGGPVLSGSTRSDNGFPLLPSLAIVSKLEEGSLMTLGLGLLSLGGGGVNFPGDTSNPVLSPTGPFNQFVLGPIFSSLQLFQLTPTVSYQVTDRLVVGLGPTIDIAIASFDPGYFAAPNINQGQLNSFPSAVNARPFWGGGFRAGLVYSVTDTIDMGFGYTSPQWMETFEFNSRDSLGNARRLSLELGLPSIYSWGVAWSALEQLTLGVDLRYFDYEKADLYGTPVNERGLGWKSAFAVAVGGDYRLTERVSVRAGYQYNTNPLENTSTLFNIQSPAIIQHTLTVGTTLALTEDISTSIGYAYGFPNSISGTVEQLPNARVGLDAESHALLFNLQIKFGSPWAAKPSACSTCTP